MKANGLSDQFPVVVASGIHPIALEDIRYYFKPNAMEENNVATLNYGLLGLMSIKPNAMEENNVATLNYGLLGLMSIKPNAMEENNVATLNYGLLGLMSILLDAKLYGYDASSQTIRIRHLDQVLKDMDRKNWYLTNYNTLGRLVHTIHMNEIWAKTKVHYDSISLLKYNENLRACVKDTKNNGLLKMLEFIKDTITRYNIGESFTNGEWCCC